uniref:X-box-binding protein 1 n=2 Tax=Leucetta chagosensis TaxID=185688 RepID=A0AAU6R3S2_9METZ
MDCTAISLDPEKYRPRKREKLDHLSPEEKLKRRKVFNRVSAQIARDRRKNYLDRLERLVATLRAENEALVVDNRSLNLSLTNLREEHIRLRSKFATSTLPASPNTFESRSVDLQPGSESAELIVSRQQKHQAVSLPITLLVAAMLSMSSVNLDSYSNLDSILAMDSLVHLKASAHLPVRPTSVFSPSLRQIAQLPLHQSPLFLPATSLRSTQKCSTLTCSAWIRMIRPKPRLAVKTSQ